MSQSEHQVTVLTANYTNLPLKEQLGNITVHRIPCKNRFLFTIKAISLATELASDHDVIHTTTYNAALPAWMASRRTRKPVLLTVHEYWGHLWWKLPYLNPAMRLLFWTYEQIILRLPFHSMVAVSKFSKQRLHERFPRRSIKVIYNGQAPLSSSMNERSNRYLFIGRLGVSKGIDLLIPALKIATEKHGLSFNLVIPQKPPKIYKMLTKTLHHAIKEGKIQIHHDVEDEALQVLLGQAKAVLIPSVTEGFGFVAAEASAMGCPIIHSGLGALDEVASGQVIVFKPYSPQGLVDALLRAEQGEFDEVAPIIHPMETMVTQYRRAYEALAQGH